MNKKSIISLIGLSLAISGLVLYRVNFAKNVRSWESYILAICIALAAFAMLYIAYKSLINRFSRSKIDPASYARLFDLENTIVSGEVEFYFTIEQTKPVVFSILDKNMQQLIEVVNQTFGAGGHIVRFDTKDLANGVYFYCLSTENQKTMKKIVVQHDNLTA
jgi:hypothetical protein